MGFRDLEKSNQALLAKSVWRLLRRPDSLVGRVYRQSYFSDGDIMTALPGSCSSSIWRSLHWGREIIQSGSRWRIGDGESVLVMGDSWVPRDRPATWIDPPWIPPNMRVAELMRLDGSWDVDLITAMFGAEDAAAILSIPCGGEGIPDVRRWHFTENGEYSVKSGYRVAMERVSTPAASSSDPTVMER